MRVVIESYEEDMKARDGVWLRIKYSVGISKNLSSLDIFVHNGEEITRDLVKQRTKKALESLSQRVSVEMKP